MIPKIVHYCWISDDSWDKKTSECFDSWKKYIPEYKFMLWNKDTLPEYIMQTPAVQYALKYKRWAFVADYVRFWALYSYGGIYMDLDVELLKPLDSLISNQLFFGLEKQRLGAHVIGAQKGNEFVGIVLRKLEFKQNFMPLPEFVTSIYLEHYRESPREIRSHAISIYPNCTFNPYFWDEINNVSTLNVTDQTICIHWYAGGWQPKYKKKGLYKFILLFLERIKVLKYLRIIRGY